MKMTQEKRDELVDLILAMLRRTLNDPEIAAIQLVHKDGSSVGTIPIPPPVGCEFDKGTCVPTGTGEFAVDEG